MTEISESRTREIQHWLDDRLAEPDLPYQAMAMLRDAAALIRQLQAAEQAARASAAEREIEALRADLADYMRIANTEATRAERLSEALRVAEAALADIGDADREPGDDVAWCECRAAEPLPMIRALLRDQEDGDEA